MTKPELVIAKMLESDYFTEWLGLSVEEISEGYCRLNYTVRKEMLNGFGTIHGGVLFAASDSAFAFACNSHGVLSVALDANISFIASAIEGTMLTVEAKEIHLGNKTGFYSVTTTNTKGDLVALFKGTSYRTGKQIIGSEE